LTAVFARPTKAFGAKAPTRVAPAKTRDEDSFIGTLRSIISEDLWRRLFGDEVRAHTIFHLDSVK
jgi:hypothetical protein